MKYRLILFGGILLAVFSFRSIVNEGLIIPETFPKPVYDFNANPLNEAKIELGRALFYDPILSKDSTISCASCHSQYSAFTHVDHNVSHGINDKLGFRNAPVLMNLAWKSLFMHDGAVNHLDVQAMAPITNADEMGENLNNVILKLQKSPLYCQLFQKAYGDNTVNSGRMLKAISQFMLTLVSSDSKYDSVVRNQSQFSLKEQKGYVLFKQHCNQCHTEPLFTNDAFMNNGLSVDLKYNDLGRYRVTQQKEDSFKFKVPTLRNIEFSYPYMHDGRFKKLAQVFNHYGKVHSANANSTLAKELRNGIILTADEKVELTSFLLTLTDKTFLFNKDHSFPKQIFLKN